MIRPHLLKGLADLGHARISHKTLEEAIVLEMNSGYRPMFRGQEWGRAHFAAIEAAGIAIQMAWDLLKWVQFPEAESRIDDALERLDQMRPALAANKNIVRATSRAAPTPAHMLPAHSETK